MYHVLIQQLLLRECFTKVALQLFIIWHASCGVRIYCCGGVVFTHRGQSVSSVRLPDEKAYSHFKVTIEGDLCKRLDSNMAQRRAKLRIRVLYMLVT